MRWTSIQGMLKLWTQMNAEHVINVRKRFTIAEINAGAELLALQNGYKFRLVDVQMIAIGGAVGATTTVDITATLAGSSRKLLAVAAAALTRSTVVRMGDTDAVVLADGASYTANDVSTSLRVGKTGATATTATGIDVIASVAVDVP